ncbi:unnamed protein product [Protopolystoma xenopodis]|uniref:Uncharacterized protein n=1 Tax=Protopolystoma xenopodis TaxID=117903 RepID=A0A3S5CM14_9PLAT|nr:unnamed protein product [Protopolystoma xenopodis]
MTLPFEPLTYRPNLHGMPAPQLESSHQPLRQWALVYGNPLQALVTGVSEGHLTIGF